jgi:transcriptional regulator with XRE-family HTH domain
LITNERQHRITRAEIKKFEGAISRAENAEPADDVHPRLHEAMIDGLSSQLEELREEVEQYEALREGKIKGRVLTSLRELPTALIEARIVRRLTQKQLAKKLGVPEQQIQRYEKTRYAGVSLERMQEVADALGINLENTVEYDVRKSSTSRSRTPARSSGRRRRRLAQTASRSSVASSRSKSGKTAVPQMKRARKAASAKAKKTSAAAKKTRASRSGAKTA